MNGRTVTSKSLALAGFDHYVAINRFDIWRAAQPYEDATASNRYRYRPIEVPVSFLVNRNGTPFVAYGTASQISEVGALIDCIDAQAQALKRLKVQSGDYVHIDFLDPVDRADGRVVSFESLADSVRIEVEFIRVRSVAAFVDEDPLEVSRMRIRLEADTDEEDAVFAELVGARLYYLFELLESARATVNELIESEDPTDRRRAQPIEVESLSMQSPLELILLGTTAVGAVISLAWKAVGPWERWQRSRLVGAEVERTLAEARKTDAEAERIRAEARKIDSEADSASRKTDAEISQMQIETERLKEQVKTEVLARGVAIQENLTREALQREMRRVITEQSSGSVQLELPTGTKASSTRIEALVRDGLQGSAEGLAKQGVQRLTLELLDPPAGQSPD